MTGPAPFKIRLTLGRVIIAIALAAVCLKLYLPSFRMRVPEPLQGSWFRGTLYSFLTTGGMVQLLYWYEIPWAIHFIRQKRAHKLEASLNQKESDPIDVQDATEP